MALMCQQGMAPPCPALISWLITRMSNSMLQVSIGNPDQYLDKVKLIRDQKQRMQVTLAADMPICIALQSPMLRM